MIKELTKEQQEDFNKRVKEVFNFAKEKEIGIFATQQVTKEGYIETVPLFRNLKQYVKDVEFKTTSEVTGTDTNLENSENIGTNA